MGQDPVPVVASLVLGLALLPSCHDPVDHDFDTSVAVAAYAVDRPEVGFDEGHGNRHTCRGTYEPFVELLENDGYDVAPVRERFTRGALAPWRVLVIACAQGPGDDPAASAFEPAECEAVEAFVRDGGALLLVTDHYPFGSAVESLGARFGVRMSSGMSFDDMEFDREFGDPSELAYSRANHLLRRHEVTEGRWSGERLERVVTFTGQSVQGPEGSTLFLRHGPTAVLREARPSVSLASVGGAKGGAQGSDIHLELGAERSAVDWGQGLALRHGAGRVVVLGDATMLTALLDGEEKVGMNRRGNDNRKLALNILHWLSGAQ
ncbi:MAG: DUF4350 domain-containing protein [Planctomycetota bacterium]